MGLCQQEHPGAAQGRDAHGQAHVPRGHHPSGVGHLRQGLRVWHTQLRAQGPAVHDTASAEQAAKVNSCGHSPCFLHDNNTRGRA